MRRQSAQATNTTQHNAHSHTATASPNSAPPAVSCPVLCASSDCAYSVTSLLQVCTHCNGNGECWQGYCQCSEGYATAITDHSTAANTSSLITINSSTVSGVAESALLLDELNACTLASCPLDCTGNGVCEQDVASQTWCTLLRCAGGAMLLPLTVLALMLCVLWSCVSAGLPSCVCASGFYGLDCSLGYCSTDCNSPLGSCNYTSASCVCAATPVGSYSGGECLSFTPSAAARRHSANGWSWSWMGMVLTLYMSFHPGAAHDTRIRYGV